MNDINFSLLITSRNNDKLLRCVKSCIDTAKYPEQNEIIVLIDYDDHNSLDMLKDPVFMTQNIHTIIRPPSGHHEPFNMTKYYLNHGAKYSSGKYVWSMNAECKIETQDWDEILTEYIDKFLADKPDRLLYVAMDDNTNYLKGVMNQYGCCFPITSRESINALGGHMPGELTFWGADVVLYEIYSAISYPRILLATDVKISHESVHNGDIPIEEVQDQIDRCEKLSYVGGLEPPQKQWYINNLNAAISKYNTE